MEKVKMFFKKLGLALLWMMRFIVGLVLLILTLLSFLIIKLFIGIYKLVGILCIKVFPPMTNIIDKLR